MTYVIYIALFFMAVGILLSFIRFLIGPTASDRVVALDTMTVIGTAALVLLGYLFNRFAYIDVALVYAVLGFIGVIVIARYLEGAL